MKKISMLLSLVLAICLLAGCAGTPVVYYSNCTCPEGSHDAANTPATLPATPALPTVTGGLKTGVSFVTALADSTQGKAQYDVSMVAVLVDDDGIIHDCVIDGISASTTFDETGTITTELTPVQTKNEMGENYGMVAWGGAIAEWNQQAASFAAYVTGKTAEEVMGIAVDEATHPVDADLAASVTIAIGGFQDLIQKACNQ